MDSIVLQKSFKRPPRPVGAPSLSYFVSVFFQAVLRNFRSICWVWMLWKHKFHRRNRPRPIALSTSSRFVNNPQCRHLCANKSSNWFTYDPFLTRHQKCCDGVRYWWRREAVKPYLEALKALYHIKQGKNFSFSRPFPQNVYEWWDEQALGPARSRRA